MFDAILAHESLSWFAHGLVWMSSRWRTLRYRILGRSQRIRVSFTALLLIRTGNRYFLIRNLYRPDTFAPIGGVYKYYRSQFEIFERFEFEPEQSDDLAESDLCGDLRGYVEGRFLYGLFRWFELGRGFENSLECINREIREEMEEIGQQVTAPVFSSYELRQVRRVCEGPIGVPNMPYRQFRVFDVYEMLPEVQLKSQKFLTDLASLVSTNEDILLVTADEIKHGRTRRSGHKANAPNLIAHTAEYLIRGKSARPDLPPLRV